MSVISTTRSVENGATENGGPNGTGGKFPCKYQNLSSVALGIIFRAFTLKNNLRTSCFYLLFIGLL